MFTASIAAREAFFFCSKHTGCKTVLTESKAFIQNIFFHTDIEAYS